MANPRLVPEDLAVHWTGRPASTIRRWAMEGRISKYGTGRGNVRYDVGELHPAKRDEWTGEVIETGATPDMPRRLSAA